MCLRAHIHDTCNCGTPFYLQETCNWNSTYKRHVIGIAPTRQIRSELHLALTRLMQLRLHLQQANADIKTNAIVNQNYKANAIWNVSPDN
jgi:hypothetical protein